MSRAVAGAAALLLVVVAACGGGDEAASGGAPSAPPSADPHAGLPRRVDPADPHAPLVGLPSPHGTMSVEVTRTAPAPEPPVRWTLPEGWTETKSTRPMRAAEIEVGRTSAGEAVQCVVYTGIGGSDDENVERWIALLGPQAKAGARVETLKVGDLEVRRVEAKGAHADPMGAQSGPGRIADATLLAAIVAAPDGSRVHLKLVGPTDVVAPQAAKFDALLRSMRPR